ncbi:MAG TPA: hypothetical protein VH592_23680 [Gemmataceae bacterium]
MLTLLRCANALGKCLVSTLNDEPNIGELNQTAWDTRDTAAIGEIAASSGTPENRHGI